MILLLSSSSSRCGLPGVVVVGASSAGVNDGGRAFIVPVEVFRSSSPYIISSPLECADWQEGVHTSYLCLNGVNYGCEVGESYTGGMVDSVPVYPAGCVCGDGRISVENLTFPSSFADPLDPSLTLFDVCGDVGCFLESVSGGEYDPYESSVSVEPVCPDYNPFEGPFVPLGSSMESVLSTPDLRGCLKTSIHGWEVGHREDTGGSLRFDQSLSVRFGGGEYEDFVGGGRFRTDWWESVSGGSVAVHHVVIWLDGRYTVREEERAIPGHFDSPIRITFAGGEEISVPSPLSNASLLRGSFAGNLSAAYATSLSAYSEYVDHIVIMVGGLRVSGFSVLWANDMMAVRKIEVFGQLSHNASRASEFGGVGHYCRKCGAGEVCKGGVLNGTCVAPGLVYGGDCLCPGGSVAVQHNGSVTVCERCPVGMYCRRAVGGSRGDATRAYPCDVCGPGQVSQCASGVVGNIFGGCLNVDGSSVEYGDRRALFSALGVVYPSIFGGVFGKTLLEFGIVAQDGGTAEIAEADEWWEREYYNTIEELRRILVDVWSLNGTAAAAGDIVGHDLDFLSSSGVGVGFGVGDGSGSSDGSGDQGLGFFFRRRSAADTGGFGGVDDEEDVGGSGSGVGVGFGGFGGRSAGSGVRGGGVRKKGPRRSGGAAFGIPDVRSVLLVLEPVLQHSSGVRNVSVDAALVSSFLSAVATAPRFAGWNVIPNTVSLAGVGVGGGAATSGMSASTTAAAGGGGGGLPPPPPPPPPTTTTTTPGGGGGTTTPAPAEAPTTTTTPAPAESSSGSATWVTAGITAIVILFCFIVGAAFFFGWLSYGGKDAVAAGSGGGGVSVVVGGRGGGEGAVRGAGVAGYDRSYPDARVAGGSLRSSGVGQVRVGGGGAGYMMLPASRAAYMPLSSSGSSFVDGYRY